MLLLLLFFFAGDPLTRGIQAFHEGRYAEARAALQQAAPGPQTSAFLALTRAAQGECAAVVGELETQYAAATDPHIQRLTGLAAVDCRVRAGQFNEGERTLALLQSRFPSDADVLYEAARLHMRAWNDTLLQLYRKAPASYRVNQISAEVFEAQGRYTEAAGEYEKAIAKNPKALDLHFRLGRALLASGQSGEALQAALRAFQAELALNPSDAAAEYEVAQILAAGGDRTAALAHFERALQLAPDFPEALLAVGKRRIAEKRYTDAIALLDRAARLDPASEAVHYNLMLAYRNAGRLDDARKEQQTLERLRQPPAGEFSDFLKKLGEKPAATQQ